MTGRKFGRMTVIRRNGVIDNHAAWECLCDCGNIKTVEGRYLVRGNTISCGCYRSEITVKRSCTHKMSGKRLYRIWADMTQRCKNPKMECFKYYGGKNIRVCKEWSSFDSFMTWALSNGYSDGLTIDRINNNGNYEPSNCQWITIKEQVRKQDRTIIVFVDGKEFSLSELEELSGIKHSTLYARVFQKRPVLYEQEMERLGVKGYRIKERNKNYGKQ